MLDLRWIAQSRKAQIALGTVVSIVGVRLLVKWGFDVEAANNVTTALSVVGASWMGSIAIEDHGLNQNPEVTQESPYPNAVNRSSGQAGDAAGVSSTPPHALSTAPTSAPASPIDGERKL